MRSNDLHPVPPGSPLRKLVPVDVLAPQLAEERAAGRVVVHCHGCFDLVHPGHLRYLQYARSLGDRLVVSLTGDAAVGKGADRPYIPQELRAENLAALEFVDWVVIDPHPTAAELLEALRPDVYVKGREYADSNDPRFVKERDVVERHGGRVVFHSGDVVFSSTRLIQNLERESDLDECRLRAVCRRSAIDLPTVRRAFQQFQGLPVLVVGDVLRERYVFCDTAGIDDASPAVALRSLGETTFWGGAAALAFQLRALGARPTLLSVACEGEERERLEASCRDREVACHLRAARSAPVLHATFVADETKLYTLAEGVAAPLDSRNERELGGRIEERLSDSRLLIWCDCGYGVATPGLLATAIAAARRTSVYVSGCAPEARATAHQLRDTDLLVLTERRLRGVMHDMESGLPAVAFRFLQHTAGRRLLVSLHKRGVIGFDGRPSGASDGQVAQPPRALFRLKGEYFPSFAARFADRLGADEAGAAVASLVAATGMPLALATYLAAAAEARCVERPGRTQVTRDQLESWLSRRPELHPESRFVVEGSSNLLSALPRPTLAEVSTT